MKIKVLKIIFWTLAFAVLLTGFVLFIVGLSIDSFDKKIGLIVMVSSSILFICAFLIDAYKVMVLTPTAGDKFTLMSKGELIALLEKYDVEYEEGHPKAYYQTLIRKFVKEQEEQD